MLWRKSAMVLVMAVIAPVAFATLGDGKSKSSNSSKKSLFSLKSSVKPGSFSLKNGYTFRGSQVITNKEDKYISLNAPVTFQTGHTTYIVPLKKKVLNDKVVFNPNEATRR